MKRFECNECGNQEPCIIRPKDSEAIKKINGEWCEWCSGQNRCQWNEIDDGSLPKLTADALAERGIEWPEWATCAVVDTDELAHFFGGDIAPLYAEDEEPFWWFSDKRDGSSGVVKIPGRWDASDWRNSKIPRPKDDCKKQELPEWCKAGAWVFEVTQNKFHRIKALDSFDGRPAVRWDDRDDGYIGSCTIEHLRPARLRPWTFEEDPVLVKTKNSIEFFPACWHLGRVTKENEATFFSSNIYSSICEITASEIAEKCVQLDGSPCGVLEVMEESQS